jgi:plasmid stabilization system protein ParE
MGKRWKEIVEIIDQWPEERREDAAQILAALIEQGEGVYQLSADERRAIDLSLEQMRNGEFATDEEVAAVRRKHGLCGVDSRGMRQRIWTKCSSRSGASREATRVKFRILSAIKLLGRFPGLGTLTDDEGTRMLVATPYPYLVFYEIDVKAGEVIVLHIRHGARDRDG